jgi:hypothetical protein
VQRYLASAEQCAFEVGIKCIMCWVDKDQSWSKHSMSQCPNRVSGGCLCCFEPSHQVKDCPLKPKLARECNGRVCFMCFFPLEGTKHGRAMNCRQETTRYIDKILPTAFWCFDNQPRHQLLLQGLVPPESLVSKRSFALWLGLLHQETQLLNGFVLFSELCRQRYSI